MTDTQFLIIALLLGFIALCKLPIGDVEKTLAKSQGWKGKEVKEKVKETFLDNLIEKPKAASLEER